MFASVSISRLVEDGYVAPHPVTARERISQRYSCALTPSGHECEGIVLLRNLVRSLDSDSKFARCLVLCASHTHWDDKDIVESFDSDRDIFLNGPLKHVESLLPISFVFTSKGPAPFEWADESVSVNPTALEEIYAFISKLNELVVSEIGDCLPIPIGISIDHRFKRSVWDNQFFGYAEGYHEEEGGRAVVKPVLESIVNPGIQDPDQVQVTWNCFSDFKPAEPNLTSSEKAVFLKLESVLDEMTPGQALEFVTDLEAELRSREEALSGT